MTMKVVASRRVSTRAVAVAPEPEPELDDDEGGSSEFESAEEGDEAEVSSSEETGHDEEGDEAEVSSSEETGHDEGGDEGQGQGDEEGEGEVSGDEEVTERQEGEEVKGREEGLSGWADSMDKILRTGKPKNKKEIMLSRARKDYEVNKAANVQAKEKKKVVPTFDFEIIPDPKKVKKVKEDEDEDKDEVVKDPKNEHILSLKIQRRLELKQIKLERAWENLSRLNTEKADPIVERDLLKIATKGVVQLFNAISMQQKTIKTKIRNSKQSEFEKEKILNQTKDMFDSSLSKSKKLNHDNSQSEDDEMKIKEEIKEEERQSKKRKCAEAQSKNSKKKPAWNALQDNYMLDAKLKDWDKESDSDDESD